MTRARGNYAKTANRRAAIIQASFEVFASVGYQRGSIKDIADLIGMSRAGVQHHFPDKVQLLEAVLRLRDQHAQELLAGKDGIAFIRALVGVIEHNSSIPGLIELYSMLAAEAAPPKHPAHAYFATRNEFVLRGITEAFSAAQKDGDLVEGIDPHTAAVEHVALTEGLQLAWLYNHDINITASVRRHLQSLVAVQL
jgi:AcrR family transcriptional regulator